MLYKVVYEVSVTNITKEVCLVFLSHSLQTKSYFLLLCGLFYEAICFMSYLVLFHYCVFSPFSIAITSLGEDRAYLSAFGTSVRFALVWFCLFLLVFRKGFDL